MSHAICFQGPQRKLSTQMRAVLMILEADPYLKDALSPHIDLNLESIYWDKIFKLPFGSGHSTIVSWLYGIWTDEPRPRANLFDGSLNLSPKLQAAILKALALRWGLVA
jgi:hypothetical protein